MSRKLKRRTLLVLVLLGSLVAGGLAFASLNRSAITPENAAKISEGQTLKEVERLLGGPARDESTGPLYLAVPIDPNMPDPAIRMLVTAGRPAPPVRG